MTEYVTNCQKCQKEIRRPWEAQFCSRDCQNAALIISESEHEARFWASVRKADGDECWEWQGAFEKDGYGYSEKVINGVTYRGAHRYSYALHFGPIPDGLCVCHRCDNPKCVRPDHLFLGTNYDNVQDRERKGRGGGGRKPGCAQKLTEENVLLIREKYARGELNQKAEALKLGVDPSMISRLARGQRWGHV